MRSPFVFSRSGFLLGAALALVAAVLKVLLVRRAEELPVAP